jgi:rubrerythrin
MMRRWQRELQAEEYRRERAAIEAERACSVRALHDGIGSRDTVTCERCGPQEASDCNDLQCPHCGGNLR